MTDNLEEKMISLETSTSPSLSDIEDESDSMKIFMADLRPMDKSNRLRNNKIALRSSILRDYLKGKSITKAYKSFCDLVGSDVLEYREFDFWYYKLGKEEIALDIDIEWDPESKSLADMPTEIIKEIINNNSPVDRLNLRKVSQRFCSIIDCSDLGIKSIDCEISFYQAVIALTENNSEEGKESITYSDSNKSSLYVEKAVKDLTVILKNPKLRLEQFNITFDMSNIEERKNDVTYFASMLKQCSPILAKQVSVHSYDKFDVSEILSLFQPATLEHISLKVRDLANQSAIIHLEQWKQLRSAELRTLQQELQFPIEHLFHLSSFEVKLESFSVDDAIKIRDILLKSPSFRSGKFRFSDSDVVEIFKVFAPDYHGNGNDSIEYSTTDSNFLIECENRCIIFRKV